MFQVLSRGKRTNLDAHVFVPECIEYMYQEDNVHRDLHGSHPQSSSVHSVGMKEQYQEIKEASSPSVFFAKIRTF
jgi:hypothetical protein